MRKMCELSRVKSGIEEVMLFKGLQESCVGLMISAQVVVAVS